MTAFPASSQRRINNANLAEIVHKYASGMGLVHGYNRGFPGWVIVFLGWGDVAGGEFAARVKRPAGRGCIESSAQRQPIPLGYPGATLTG